MKYTEKFKNDLKLAVFIMNIVKPETENYRVITSNLVKYDNRISDEYRQIIINAIMKDKI